MRSGGARSGSSLSVKRDKKITFPIADGWREGMCKVERSAIDLNFMFCNNASFAMQSLGS